jgi:hypothetical protein
MNLEDDDKQRIGKGLEGSDYDLFEFFSVILLRELRKTIKPIISHFLSRKSNQLTPE